MADERIFKVKIDGLDKSYKDVVKLVDVLQSMEDANAKVAIETNKVSQATREKTKALTDEEKAQKKLEQTKAKLKNSDSELNKQQELANLQLREKTKLLKWQIQEEQSAIGSMDETKAKLERLIITYKALSEEEQRAEHIGGDMLKQIDELKTKYDDLNSSLRNTLSGSFNKLSNELQSSFDNLATGVNTMSTATNDLSNSLQTITGGVGGFNVQTKESRALLMGLSKVMTLVTKLNKSHTSSLQATAKAQEANTVATGTATVATRTFSKALIATGIGALVVGLGLLVANFKDVKKWLLEVYPPLEKLGDYFNEFKAIAMGVGNAIVEYITTPFKTVFAVVKGFMENGISGAIDGAKEAVKNGLNVIGNYEKGYQKEKASQERDAYLERLKLRQQELEDIMADNEAKLGSDWKYSKEAQKAYRELHNVKRELNADDLEETKKLERERMSYLREIREKESQSAKEREAERKKETERMLALEKSLQDEKTKAIKDEETREIEALKIATQRRLDEIKGNSQTEIDLRKQIEENLSVEIEDIEQKYSEKREAKKKEEAEKALSEAQKRHENELRILDESLKKQDLAVLKSYESQELTKDEFNSKMRDSLISSLNEEIKIREKYGESTTDLEIELSKIRIEQAQKEQDKVSESFEDLHKSMMETLNNIASSITSVFDIASMIIDSQLEDAREKYDAISQKYDESVKRREESDSRLQELEEQAKNARGGRSLILQEQINSEMQANQNLANQEKNLAKEKEKQEKEIAKKEKQQRRISLSQSLLQIIASTSEGMMKAYASSPLTLGLPWSAIIGATGAIQAGLVTAQIAKLEDGGLLNGKRHSQGGMRVEGTNIEVEGGEYVVNRESTAKNLGLIRYINTQRKELSPDDVNSYFSTGSKGYEPPFKQMFETGGQLPNIENNVTVDNGALVEAIESMRIEPKVSVTDINTAQKDVVRIDDWTNL